MTGRAPAITREPPTNLGLLADDRVQRAHEQIRLGVDPDYDLVYENFDVLHYLLQCPDLWDRTDVDVVADFLEHGVEKRLDPHPDFSMTEYLRRHPSAARSGSGTHPYVAWLREGRAAGLLADPAPRVARMAEVIGRNRDDVVDLLTSRRRDLNLRLRHGTLGRMFAEAAELEPLVGDAWPEVVRPRLLPFSHLEVADEVVALHQAQRAAEFRRARLVFVINRGRWGGGRRMEGHLAHALATWVDPSDMVVVYTDESGTAPPGRYPEGVREVDLAQLTRGLSGAAAQHALVVLLRSLGADAVVNVNSRLLYRAMRTHGKALALSERVFPVFFCNEQSGWGTWRGWSLRYFYRLYDQVAGVITDSHHLAHQLAGTAGVDQTDLDRLHVFEAPVDPGIQLADPPPRSPRRRQVFWAGRWDRQKRVDLLLEVARALPEVDFRMWGEPVMGGRAQDLPDNVLPEGRYGHFSALPMHEADAWLYTSAWDGVPSLLLEVAMTGVPLVGTRVGGTGEILGGSDAWPVAEDAGAAAYVTALREVLADPAAARARGRALRERLVSGRTVDAFARRAVEVLLPGAQSVEMAKGSHEHA